MNKKLVVMATVLVMMLVGCDRAGVSNTEFIGNWVRLEPKSPEDKRRGAAPIYVRYYELSENGSLRLTTWELKQASDYAPSLTKQGLDARSTSSRLVKHVIEGGSWSWNGRLFTVDIRELGGFVRTHYKIAKHSDNNGVKRLQLLLADQDKSIEHGITWNERTIKE